MPPRINGQTKDYIRAIEYLEAQGYIKVDRPYAHHRTWVVTGLDVPEQLQPASTQPRGFR